MLRLLSLAMFSMASVLTSYDDLTKDIDRCTTIAVGKKAGRDGPMVTHTADCLDCDFRVNKVPARDWPDNSKRNTYEYKNNYPSNIAMDRGETWLPSNLEGSPNQLKLWGNKSVLTGQIPQVKHTFALIEAGYAIMNEHQLGIGESTCAARFWAAPTSAGGKAQIEVREMSRLALERTRTAREAILLMGSLAEQYGFYAADWGGGDGSKGEGGETLTVCDPQEAWVFHVLADDTGTSAVWAAQRVPDDHVAAIANQFIIREVDPSSDSFMFSKNLWEVASRNNLWNKAMGPLDFLLTYAPMRAHSTYVTRRRWRVFQLVAPSLDLPAETDPYATNYPFSVKADKPLSAADLMQIQRDHYEGSPYDMTKGLAAGPFGDPNRFDAFPTSNMTQKEVTNGSFERAISLFRTSYSIVVESRAKLPNVLARVWFCQYAPATSSYTPLYVASSSLPRAYTKGSLFKFDWDVAFWNFAVVGNYAARFYSYAIRDIHDLQQRLLDVALTETAAAEAETLEVLGRLLGGGGGTKALKSSAIREESVLEEAVKILTHVTNAQGAATVRAWKDFFPQLVTKYHDGYRAELLDGPAIHMQKLFYPKWWLELVGFFNNRAATGPNTLLFEPSPNAISDSDRASFASFPGSGKASGMVPNTPSVPKVPNYPKLPDHYPSQPAIPTVPTMPTVPSVPTVPSSPLHIGDTNQIVHPAVGAYVDGLPPVPSVPTTIADRYTRAAASDEQAGSTMALLMCVVASSVFSLFVGVWLGRKYSPRADYISINV